MTTAKENLKAAITNTVSAAPRTYLLNLLDQIEEVDHSTKPLALLTFARLSSVNLARCVRWHPPVGINAWTPERWMTATTGELGEAANALKKLFRIEDGIANVNDAARVIDTRDAAIAKIAEEVADTFIYLNLFALRLGIHPENEIIKKFNATSEKYGFPERL